MKLNYDWWKDYPERDREYVRYYPCRFFPIKEEDVWKEQREKPRTYDGIGLYFHIPLCSTNCGFCPFNKFVTTPELENKFMDALDIEMDLYSKLPFVQSKKINTIYFGGGTPTSLSIGRLEKFLNRVKDRFNLADDIQVSTECHPLTATEDKLTLMHEWGVDRIALGTQSFNDKTLKTLGCPHKAETSWNAVKTAQKVGFKKIATDSLFRVPGQNMEDWEQELKDAVDSGANHITTYSLVLTPETPIWKWIENGKIPNQPDEAADMEMARFAKEYLTGQGLQMYTLSDYSRDKIDYKYKNYCWRAPQGEYLGLGAGAFEAVNDHTSCKIHDVNEYVKVLNEGKIPYLMGAKVTDRQRMSRFFVLGVKYLEVDLDDFKKQYNVDAHSIFGEQFKKLEHYKLIEFEGSKMKLTDKGWLYVDNVSKAFYTEDQLMTPHPIEMLLVEGEEAIPAKAV